jgi:hypothetical protein
MTNESTGLEHLDDLKPKLRKIFEEFAEATEPSFQFHSVERNEEQTLVLFEDAEGRTWACSIQKDAASFTRAD